MAVDNPGTETPPPAQSDTIVVPSKGTVDVLNNGEPIGTNKNLEAIFSKIEKGVKADEAVKDTMAKKAAPAPVKPAEDLTQPIADKKELEESDLNKKLTQIQDKKEEPVEEPADPREALKKAAEPKVETKVEVKDEPAKEDEVPEDELQVLAHDKPKTAKRIQALLKKIDSANSIVTETKKEAEAKSKRLIELESQLKDVKPTDPKQQEAVQAQLDELAMYRRQYSLEKDPAVKEKFDNRIEATSKPITDILTRNRAGEPLLKLINEEGGWFKFASSIKPVTLEGGVVTTYADLADRILGELPTMDRKAIETSVMENIQLTRDRERYFEEEKGKAKEYFTKQDEQFKQQNEAVQKQVQANQKMIDDWQKTMFEKEDWLKEKPVPPEASAAEKAAIESDNKYTKQLGQLLKQSVKVQELPKILEMVTDSIKYYDERRKTARLSDELKIARSERDAAKAEVDKIRSAGKSTPKAGSIASQKDSPSQQQKAKPASLEDAFDRLSRGEALSPTIQSQEE